MERKSIGTLGTLVLLAALAVPMISGCITTPEGEQGVTFIENMDDAEYANLRLFLTLGVKVGANRALVEGLLTDQDLETGAQVLELVLETPVTEGMTLIITPHLEKLGLMESEIGLILVVAESQLIKSGALEYFDEDGRLALSPRTKEILQDLIDALREAQTITTTEEADLKVLQMQFE